LVFHVRTSFKKVFTTKGTKDTKKKADSSQLIGKIMPIVENVLSVSYELAAMSSKICVLRGGSNLIPSAG
jgi:hypothetical protein